MVIITSLLPEEDGFLVSAPLFILIFLKKLFIYFYFIFGCAESLFCTWAFSSCDGLGLLSCCNAWASHSGGFSCCRKQF